MTIALVTFTIAGASIIGNVVIYRQGRKLSRELDRMEAELDRMEQDTP